MNCRSYRRSRSNEVDGETLKFLEWSFWLRNETDADTDSLLALSVTHARASKFLAGTQVQRACTITVRSCCRADEAMLFCTPCSAVCRRYTTSPIYRRLCAGAHCIWFKIDGSHVALTMRLRAHVAISCHEMALPLRLHVEGTWVLAGLICYIMLWSRRARLKM